MDNTSKNIKVRRISDAAGWADLESQWDALLGASSSNAVFLCWDWLDTWLKIYGSGGKWAVLVAEDMEGNLLGSAPMMIDRGSRAPGKWIRRLLLLGQKADTASEYLDWIIHSGHEAEVSQAFIHFVFNDMGREWDIIQFDAMRGNSSTIPFLISAFKKRGIALLPLQISTAPFVSLPDTWKEFMAQRSSTSRQRWNKFNRDHHVVIRSVGKNLTVSAGMEIIRRLNALRWGDARQSFLSERYVRFHDQIAERFHKKGFLILLFLEVDGDIIAGRYDFSYGGKGWCFQGGWQPDLEHLRPGRMMMTTMMEYCISQGLQEYDFLGGEASYKKEWSDGERTIVSLNATNPYSLRGRIYSLARRAWLSLRSKS